MSAYTGGAASGASSAKPPDDTVTLLVGTSFSGGQLVGGQTLSGWESVRITRGLDRCPSDFEIALTEKYPGQPSQVVASPGQPCQVLIGPTVVITGYIDKYMPSFSAARHEVRISGRSKCEDLVDCSITPSLLTGMSMTVAFMLSLAQKLAQPYGITVSSLTGDNVPVKPPGAAIAAPVTFSAVLTETPYEILERVARYVGVLLYDGTDGNLIIANVGVGTHASGFAQGMNVESAAVAYTMDERFRTYLPQAMPFTAWQAESVNTIYSPATDQDARQGRELIVVSEQFASFPGLAERRAQWEMARRIGRSKSVHLTCDSWRDQAGTLWSPNFFAPVNLPALKLVTTAPWIVGQVTFRRDETGTHADLVLMPSGAFQPMPAPLAPFPWGNQTPAPAGGGAATNLPPQDGVS